MVESSDESGKKVRYLSVLNNDWQGDRATFLGELEPGKPLLIGREVIERAAQKTAPAVSRQHCTVGLDKDGLLKVIDGNSTNGTSVFTRERGASRPSQFGVGVWSRPTSEIRELIEKQGQRTNEVRGAATNENLAEVVKGESARYVTQEIADKLDLASISKETLFKDVPPDSKIIVNHEGGYPGLRLPDPKFREYGNQNTLYKDKNGELFLIEKTDEGREDYVPVRWSGASLTANAFFMGEVGTEKENPRLIDGTYAHFSEFIEFRSGSDSGVPEIYELFDNPEKMDEGTLAYHLKQGNVVRNHNGELVYHFPKREIVFGPINSVEVVPNNEFERPTGQEAHESEDDNVKARHEYWAGFLRDNYPSEAYMERFGIESITPGLLIKLEDELSDNDSDSGEVGMLTRKLKRTFLDDIKSGRAAQWQ